MREKSSLPLGPLFLVCVMVLPAAPSWAVAMEPEPQEKPDAAIVLSPIVTKLLNDPATNDAQRRKLALFHGQWDRLKDPTVAEKAQMALWRYDLNDPALADERAPALIRAQAALLRGEGELAIGLLQDDTATPAALVRAQAHQMLGQFPEAVAILTPIRTRLQEQPVDDAQELTCAAQTMLVLARLEGRPAQDYHTAMRLFARVRDEIDRLYWPAHLYEAQLLLEKDNAPDAQKAAVDALRLNPRCGEAYFLMGDLAAENFDFQTADACIAELRKIQSDHLLASILEARMRLVQKDVAGAFAAIEPVLAQYPKQRDMLALLAAAQALAYDEAGMRQALDHYDALSPRSAEAYFATGMYLSMARQYALSEAMLREAIDREPNWPQPHVELGLLLMQAGNEGGAVLELRQAAQLDPFHRRANNQLTLVEELLTYKQIETEHFVIKYRDGVDVVLARDMPEVLEQIYREVTATFAHQPANKTLIEIMPDENWFGVRITGMPEIWTIAACTGDVISITPPRSGARQRGTYYWPNVIKHEFGHTVTLDQTDNRIPHWFTEACSVSLETTGRTYETCQMLATALQKDRLFELDEINWGFIRPQKPLDRPLAYAQADWMIEYIAAEYGHDKLVAMLRMFQQGASDMDALKAATGRNPSQFLESFKGWAHQQVALWGLEPQVTIPDFPTDFASAANLSDARLQELAAAHPHHAELLRAIAVRAVTHADPQTARQAVLRYATARPVDPWSYRQLVTLAAKTNRRNEVIGSLEQLDRQENEHGQWAFQLAKIHRADNHLEQAAQAAMRALYREPYNAEYRELAATIALQRGEVDRALLHMEAMAILEPTRAVHAVRLAALYHRLSETDKADEYAQKALAIDPEAPVQEYLQTPQPAPMDD